MNVIESMVTEREVLEIDRVVKEIYSIEYPNNYSTAYNLGFDTVSNHNGSGYKNLIRIIDDLNDGGENEAFARFILQKVLNEKKIERLKKVVEKNRNSYISILYL